MLRQIAASSATDVVRRCRPLDGGVRRQTTNTYEDQAVERGSAIFRRRRRGARPRPTDGSAGAQALPVAAATPLRPRVSHPLAGAAPSCLCQRWPHPARGLALGLLPSRKPASLFCGPAMAHSLPWLRLPPHREPPSLFLAPRWPISDPAWGWSPSASRRPSSLTPLGT